MQSLLSIDGVAQVLSFVSLPAVILAVAVAFVILTGGAERFALFVEDITIQLTQRRGQRG